MTEPIINPETGYEYGLPEPRPRDELWREILASDQKYSPTPLSDVYFKLQWIIEQLRPFMEREMAAHHREMRRAERKMRQAERQIKQEIKTVDITKRPRHKRKYF